jgi:hypothetical protein
MDQVMRLLLFLMLTIVLFSCSKTKTTSSQKQTVLIKDSIVYVEKVDTIPVYIPGDSIRVEVQLPCFDSLGKPVALKFKSTGKRSKLNGSVKNNTLSIMCQCEEYKDSIYHLNKSIQVYKTQKETNEKLFELVKKNNGVIWKLLLWAVVTTLIIIVYIIFKIVV